MSALNDRSPRGGGGSDTMRGVYGRTADCTRSCAATHNGNQANSQSAQPPAPDPTSSALADATRPQRQGEPSGTPKVQRRITKRSKAALGTGRGSRSDNRASRPEVISQRPAPLTRTAVEGMPGVSWTYGGTEKVPSRKEIREARTPAGGWTRPQLQAWGVPWPPPRGWVALLVRSSAEGWVPHGWSAPVLGAPQPDALKRTRRERRPRLEKLPPAAENWRPSGTVF